MEAVFDANFHFDGGVEFRVGAQCVDHNVHLFTYVVQSSNHRGTKKVPKNVTTFLNPVYNVHTFSGT